MKALLDTHTFLWWNMDEPRLSEKARAFILDGRNELYFSAASAWEIAIKVERGRLYLPEVPQEYVGKRLVLHQIHPLPIEISHALHVHELPPLHRDPFDRLLVAQSLLENLPILTSDPDIHQYEVNIIW
jgi:PIN domain nuclease of toxin-antitoxin system